MRKRSVLIAGHRTSVSLEAAFWSGLKDIAAARGLSVNRLVETIDQGRQTNLSSAIRVFVLGHCREAPSAPAVIPELDVADLARSLDFYRTALGFETRFERREEAFAYLTRGPVHLMLEQADGPGRRFRTAPLEPPFGRGLNLQIEVPDIDALHARACAAGARLHLPLEERWYRQGETESGNRQFVIEDPDGYLLRFYGDLGRRPASEDMDR